MPNNGTLRLPLSPIGLHDDDEGSAIETPPDPVESPKATGSAAGSQSPNTALTMEPSTISPTTSTAAAAATTESVVVDLSPMPTDAIGDEDDNDEQMDDKHSFWDWLTDKIGGVWDKITGSPE